MIFKTIIIDDHPLFNDGLSLILKESGIFDVIKQIYDSRQAVFNYQSLNPDLVLVDYNMPHFDGLQVVKQLKAINEGPKIVVISMYADRRELAAFEAAGVDGYFTKTTASSEMISSLLKIMDGEKIITTSIKKKETAVKDFFALKHQLTKRELEVLKNLKKGFTTEQIAAQMNLSYYTIETHRKNINQKLNFKNKQEFYEFLKEVE